MAKHRVSKEGRSLFGSRKRDSLFERSFTRCHGCGDDVYVLAEDCRACGAVLNAATSNPAPEPVRHAQPVPQAHYAQLARQAQPLAQPRPVLQARPVHYAQLASQARLAAVAGEPKLRAS
ncbi:hypothetical protein [Labedaea rhizosphaerae]|uniref:Uncharacterized protein n=1 Tax=Labedaea rhizosphaerae TaxID=598644 RepID=A0A4R6S3F8_LABRH|nr:hypothetical protein [Labedaea rhizosphaerae]TDP93833.1 hypothetical protein EV186_106227 [Labedaea rhizosphaerae]